MIRRTVKSGLLATVAVLAFLPTTASAAEAGHIALQPVPAAVAQHPLSAFLPAPVRHAPVRHHVRHRRHVHGTTHCARRVHRVVRSAVYRHRLHTVGRVATHRHALNVRSGPGTGYRVVGHRHANRHLTITCKTYGSRVYGNSTWYRLAHHKGYVSARYVRVGTAVPWC
ncbi:SH3 domain-containing protein [Streptomyces sp. NPDC001978]|uniref:SH3 domain-containing protein n=1 Tax=Streptomyces sp. NPDC001978 TaxID=3364627 RepID=UPI0036A42F3D